MGDMEYHYTKVNGRPTKERNQKERENETLRVQGYPNRITVFVFAKKTSLTFEGVKTINNIPYLKELVKKLENPPPVNSLEAEALNVV
ncbi:hypothetical protein AgCh_017356 [Apium graveolens]